MIIVDSFSLLLVGYSFTTPIGENYDVNDSSFYSFLQKQKKETSFVDKTDCSSIKVKFSNIILCRFY